eukprot:3124236-Rhodomonas_salina.3
MSEDSKVLPLPLLRHVLSTACSCQHMAFPKLAVLSIAISADVWLWLLAAGVRPRRTAARCRRCGRRRR